MKPARIASIMTPGAERSLKATWRLVHTSVFRGLLAAATTAILLSGILTEHGSVCNIAWNGKRALQDSPLIGNMRDCANGGRAVISVCKWTLLRSKSGTYEHHSAISTLLSAYMWSKLVCSRLVQPSQHEVRPFFIGVSSFRTARSYTVKISN